MRVVILSKALVVGAYQRKLEELARLPGMDLVAIVPPEWRDRRGNVKLERSHSTGYTLEVAPIALNGHYHAHFYPTLGHLLRRFRPDLLHVDEEPYNLATWHALRLAESTGLPGLFFTWQNLRRWYPWPFRHFEQASYRRAAYAIAGNRAAVEVLRAKGYTGPAAIIPQFGVDPVLFSPAVPGTESRPPARDLPSAPFRIGYAGALIVEKGVDLLLRASAALPFRTWMLEISGEGPERERLRHSGDTLGIAGQLHFRGRIPSNAMPGFYQGLDVLVLPSVSRPNWIEQFGRVLIEAMACGVPVVGSSCGEIPHVIGDAGIIFPEGNLHALVHALSALAADPAWRAELAQRGRARVLEHFTQAQIAAATYSVYREVITRGGTSMPENSRTSAELNTLWSEKR